ncbi:hypothetical protein TYRP_021207 [Tyrophagus putrescentiae]|nr:hypothetical protein TYRP_021207 [Tyrophagus putrescentiae]
MVNVVEVTKAETRVHKEDQQISGDGEGRGEGVQVEECLLDGGKGNRLQYSLLASSPVSTHHAAHHSAHHSHSPAISAIPAMTPAPWKEQRYHLGLVMVVPPTATTTATHWNRLLTVTGVAAAAVATASSAPASLADDDNVSFVLFCRGTACDEVQPQSCCTMWTPFSATIIVGVFVLQLGTAGMTEASMMRKLPIPLTLSRSSTTASGELALPIRLLPTSW